jgi:hypothetical protein
MIRLIAPYQLVVFLVTPIAVMALGAIIAGYALWAAKHGR